MKKLICFTLAVSLMLGLTACKGSTAGNSSAGQTLLESSQSTDQKEINLLYTYSDSFNPYTATTAANRELSGLLYDCLVKTDNNFEPRFILASSAKNEETTCTVKLRDATFTDGSAVTAEDVIYSYGLAKNTARFADNFYEITSVSAADSKTVVFALSQNDPYFTNLLDFPIIKSGTSGVLNDDGREVAPIGCGRYCLADDGLSLKINTNYYGKIGVIKTINLINSPDAVSTAHYVEIGATQLYYTDNGNIVRMSGKKTDVNLNRLVYIGINSSYGSLQTKEMRYAISSALDRMSICRTAYYNNATAANGFFNSSFKAASAVQTIEDTPNSKITVENLAKIGYNNMNADGFYANESGNSPAFTLLVNSENAQRVTAAKLIAAQCKTAGIEISVVECTYSQYVERLMTGSFQLYLGEVQLLDNMDMSALVTAGGSASYGVKVDEAQAEPDSNQEGTDAEAPAQQSNGCKSILDAYHLGQCSISDVAGTLLTEMPQIPLCFLNGSLFYDADIKGEIKASSSDIYLTIQNYEF